MAEKAIAEMTCRERLDALFKLLSGTRLIEPRLYRKVKDFCTDLPADDPEPFRRRYVDRDGLPDVGQLCICWARDDSYELYRYRDGKWHWGENVKPHSIRSKPVGDQGLVVSYFPIPEHGPPAPEPPPCPPVGTRLLCRRKSDGAKGVAQIVDRPDSPVGYVIQRKFWPAVGYGFWDAFHEEFHYRVIEEDEG